MANFCGTARSNFVRVKDIDAAIADLEPFSNQIHHHPSEPDAIMVSGDDDSGTINNSTFDDEGNDIELDWSGWCAKHLKEGQIMVFMSAGAEKLRYVSAWAEAYNHEGKYVGVNLDTAIDKLIEQEFGDVKYASPCYQEVV